MKKQLFHILVITFAVMLFSVVNPVIIKATELNSEEVTIYEIVANVPSDTFGEVIEVTLTDKENANFSYFTELTKENEYRKTLAIKSNITYSISYKMTNQTSYIIEDVSKEIITDNAHIKETWNIRSATPIEVDYGEEDKIELISEDMKEVYDLYLETVIPLLKDKSYESFLYPYGFDMMKMYYLQDGGDEKTWNEMDNTDCFLYYITCYYMNKSIEKAYSKADLVENLKTMRHSLEINDCVEYETVYQATLNFWENAYKSFLKNKELINFRPYFKEYYENKDDLLAEEITDIDYDNLIDQEYKESNQNTEYEDNKQQVPVKKEDKSNPFIEVMKKNFITLTLLFVVCVIAIIYYFKKMKSNK